jgi:selenocysteine lyase/cysteine desulfurase
MYDIDALRRDEFPLTEEHIYFNNASIAPLPQRTKRAMEEATAGLAQHPGHFFHEKGMAMMEGLYQSLVKLLNADSPEEIAPITTTSAGINAVAQAIPWEAGDNLAFCEWEFPSNAYPWISLERDGVEARRVTAVDGGLTLSELEKVVDGNTRLVAASAVQFFSGHRTDLQAIGDFCREREILFVVDAIQAIGHMPIDVAAMGIDVLASGGQKSLLAAPGIGFLYVRADVAEMMRPRLIGPNATRDFLHWLDYDMTPLPAARRFMAGSPNMVGMFGLLESVKLLQELGVAAIEEHTVSLSRQARERLADLGYDVITPAEALGPIVTFKTGLDEAETDALVAYLDGRQIAVVKHLDPDGAPHIRLSFHAFNTADEVERLAQVLADWEK